MHIKTIIAKMKWQKLANIVSFKLCKLHSFGFYGFKPYKQWQKVANISKWFCHCSLSMSTLLHIYNENRIICDKLKDMISHVEDSNVRSKPSHAVYKF